MRRRRPQKDALDHRALHGLLVRVEVLDRFEVEAQVSGDTLGAAEEPALSTDP